MQKAQYPLGFFYVKIATPVWLALNIRTKGVATLACWQRPYSWRGLNFVTASGEAIAGTMSRELPGTLFTRLARLTGRPFPDLFLAPRLKLVLL